MLTFLFQNKFSSEEVWNHLENYFLGVLPVELQQSEKQIDPSELQSVSIQLETGDDLADDYENWDDANILFDNDEIEKFGNESIPLADYYNAKLIIGDEEIEVVLAWLDEKILITSGEEEEVLRESAKRGGWTCIPLGDVTANLIKTFFIGA